MLALEINNYTHPWQVPLILILLFGWIVGGGWVLQHRLIRLTGKKRTKLATGMLGTFLVMIVAGLPALVGLKIGTVLADATSGVVIGAILGLAAFLLFSYLLFFAMYRLSAGETTQLWAPTIALIVALVAAIGSACAIPAYYIHQDRIAMKEMFLESQDDLFHIRRAIRITSPHDPPKRLSVLVEEGVLLPEHLEHPAAEGHEVDYFYHPTPLVSAVTERDKLLACDWDDTHPNGDRIVVYVSGKIEQISPLVFEQILDEPQNAEFARALRAVEGS